MSTDGQQLQPPDSVRARAERRLAETAPVDVAPLTRDEMQALVYELEVHKLELEIQNEQLRETERSVAEINERLRRLYDAAPTGFLSVDYNGLIFEANRSIALILKTPRDAIVGKMLSSFVSAHCQDRLRISLKDLSEGSQRKDFMLEAISSESNKLDLQVVAVSDVEGSTGPAKVHLTLIDMTEMNKMHRALQSALRAATLAEERERQKLAGELHDDAGQLLALASIKLRALVDSPEMERGVRAADLESLLAELRHRISSLSFQLSPPLLRDVGLIAALQSLADDLHSNYQLTVKIFEEQELDLDENARIVFYRAIRELLVNVVKHAGVKEATVRVARNGPVARISVEDAGVGMPMRIHRRGFGLLAMRDRIEQLGGSLEILSIPNRGTTIAISLPTVPEFDEQGGK